MIGHNIPWSKEDSDKLCREWHRNSHIKPAPRAVMLAPDFKRTAWAILRKAENLGLIIRHQHKADGADKPAGSDARIYRAGSHEDEWRKAWMRAHGTRGYDGRPIGV